MGKPGIVSGETFLAVAHLRHRQIAKDDVKNIEPHDQHQRRKVDRAGIGHDPPNRIEDRVEQGVYRAPDCGDEIVAHVHDVEADEQAQHELDDHQHDDDRDHVADDLGEGEKQHVWAFFVALRPVSHGSTP